MSKKIYISGKISGATDDEIALFEKAEIVLKEEGWDVVNPLKLNHDHELTWEAYMKVDIKALLDCDAIYLLPTYKDNSKGAALEVVIAYSLNFQVVTP